MKKLLALMLSMAMAFTMSTNIMAYSDVDEGTYVAEAVSVLSSLDIINGYEDGTFRPNDTISRAEAAKMIVAMLNKTATADGRKGETQFNDVSADHWASGFINVGVADKFINGKSSTSFDPEGNVKYNEIVKMIVACMGYEEYAQFYGGYPTGYVTIADAENITKGCSMDGEAYATRGVVAQLIYNALNTPIIQYKGMQYSATQGAFVPNVEKQDGEESVYYKSLLTEKFDAYAVEGYVIANKKSDETLKTDEVKITISKTEKYNLEDGISNPVKIGNTAAADYLNTYANIIVQENEDNEFTILSIMPSGKNKTVETVLDLVDRDEEINDYIRIFDSEDDAKSKKYKLEADYKLYVNGVEDTDKNIDKYIVGNKVGRLVLTDTYKSVEGYDIVAVDYFETALVKSTTSKKIYTTITEAYGTSLAIDEETLEEDEVVINVYLGDEVATIEDIQEDDILSIRYANNFYDIFISRAYAEGRVSSIDPVEKEIIVDGYTYEFIDESMLSAVKLGSDYKFRLDLFERIYDVEELASSTKYGIVLRTMTSDSWENLGVKLYTTDGLVKNYELSDKAAIGITNLGTATKNDLVNRVITYSVNSNGKIKEINFVDGKEKIADFDERNSKIGNIILSDTTAVIDASEYKVSTDLNVASINTLVNDVEYSIYAFGEASKIDNSYPFVLVMNGKGSYTEDTRFAVVTKAPYNSIKEDGEEGVIVEVLYTNSDETQLMFVDEDTVVEDVKIGDIVVMNYYADGDVKDIQVIYSRDTNEITLPTDNWDLAWNTSKDMETSLVCGPIVEFNGRKYLAQIKDGKTYLDIEPTKDIVESEGAVLDIITTQDTLVYVLDKNASKNNQYFVGTEDDIVATQIDHMIDSENPFVIEWNNDEITSYAFAKIVDGVITDIYVIIEKE